MIIYQNILWVIRFLQYTFTFLHSRIKNSVHYIYLGFGNSQQQYKRTKNEANTILVKIIAE